MAEALYAYTAGLIDGEGTITLSYKQPTQYRTPIVSVSSTTYAVMEFLKSNYGGFISTHKTYKDHHKPSWSWKLARRAEVDALLRNILPYMLEPEKVRRAELILSTYDLVTLRNGKYTEKQREEKLAFEKLFLGS